MKKISYNLNKKIINTTPKLHINVELFLKLKNFETTLVILQKSFTFHVKLMANKKGTKSSDTCINQQAFKQKQMY